MSHEIQQNETTASLRTFTICVTQSDGVTPYNGTLSGSDVIVWKAGVASGNLQGTATLVTAATGKYQIALAQGDCDTLGELELAIIKTGVQSIEYVIGQVKPWDPFDSVRLGMTALPPLAILIGTVTSATTPSATSFSTNLTVSAGQLANAAYVVFIGNVTSALANQDQKITGSLGSPLALSFATGFSVAPAAGDQFIVVNR